MVSKYDKVFEMKTRTINKIIQTKFNRWLKSITDKAVAKLVKDNTIMTGGAITSMLLNEDVNDFDFYFRNKETALAVATYYVNQFSSANPTEGAGIDVPISVRAGADRIEIVCKSAGVASAESDVAQDDGVPAYKYFELSPHPQKDEAGNYIDSLVDMSNQLRKNEKGAFKPIFLSSNAITLTDQVQIVIRFFGEPEKIHENYDFIHCTNYWTSWGNEVVLNTKALECILAKELIYVGSKYPIASVCRIRKFLNRGWHITAGQILKICSQISTLNLKDFSVLREQLTGVDVAYFNEIIRKLEEKDPTAIDFAYLSTLIEEVFE